MFLFLIASGLSVVFGVMRVLNFAHGSFYMLGAYLAWQAVAWLAPMAGKLSLAALLAAVVGIRGHARAQFRARLLLYARRLSGLAGGGVARAHGRQLLARGADRGAR